MKVTPEQMEAVILEVFEGSSLTDALRKHGVTRSAFYSYKEKNMESEGDYARARHSRIELMVEQLIAIADDPDIDPNRARNMIAVRQWTASKLIPQTYGDRIEVNQNVTMDIRGVLARFDAPSLALSRPDTVVESQVVDTIQVQDTRPVGSGPIEPKECDTLAETQDQSTKLPK